MYHKFQKCREYHTLCQIIKWNLKTLIRLDSPKKRSIMKLNARPKFSNLAKSPIKKPEVGTKRTIGQLVSVPKNLPMIIAISQNQICHLLIVTKFTLVSSNLKYLNFPIKKESVS